MPIEVHGVNDVSHVPQTIERSRLRVLLSSPSMTQLKNTTLLVGRNRRLWCLSCSGRYGNPRTRRSRCCDLSCSEQASRTVSADRQSLSADPGLQSYRKSDRWAYLVVLVPVCRETRTNPHMRRHSGNYWGRNPVKIAATVPEISLASGVRHVLKADSCHGSAP